MGRRVSNQIKDMSGGGGLGEGMFEERVRVFGRLTGGPAGDRNSCVVHMGTWDPG